jgi:GT2 family glycosyltransferase
MSKTRILISILNWNKAEQTLECVSSIASEANATSADVTILVTDNGSKREDIATLEAANCDKAFTLHSLPQNLGFTGGHNIAIQLAIDKDYDYIWLVNNDLIVVEGTLAKLIEAIESNSHCGAVSPIIRSMGVDSTISSCLHTHDWESRQAKRFTAIAEAKEIQLKNPNEVWLVGTAIFFRVKAIKEVGLLEDRLFAYFDDNDIGVRLSNLGWQSECVFDASVYHETRERKDYPLYVYYLYQRNEMLFWKKHTPAKYRRFLWLKLLDTGLFDVNRLYRKGLKAQGDAALLGVSDFMRGRFGVPQLNRKPPLFLLLLCKVSAKLNHHKYMNVVEQSTTD